MTQRPSVRCACGVVTTRYVCTAWIEGVPECEVCARQRAATILRVRQSNTEILPAIRECELAYLTALVA